MRMHTPIKATAANTVARPVANIPAPAVGAAATLTTTDGRTRAVTVAQGVVVAVSKSGRIVTVETDGVKIKFTYNRSRVFRNDETVATFA